ncbi:MAG: class I SAM-dependent methyltransferase [Acidimicrobiia bacterium]
MGHDHWFEPIADHLGAAYLRYSFTKGTVQEIDFLVGALRLDATTRVLDVGCGPGRHAHELARRGIPVHGIDISDRFVELARQGAPPLATFERRDARSLRFDAEFDVAISLCQGGFGLLVGEGEDETVASGIARALRPGGRAALSAFNAYFSVKYQTDAEFDAARGIAHEHTEVRDEAGTAQAVELWTGCYTPKELRLLLRVAGLRVDAVYSVEPGRYAEAAPTTESPEFLVVATRPAG